MSSLGTYDTNDRLHNDGHMYYIQADSVLEVTFYKNIPDIQTSDLTFSQLCVSCEALPRRTHRRRVFPGKKKSLEFYCLHHLLGLLRCTGPLQPKFSYQWRQHKNISIVLYINKRYYTNYSLRGGNCRPNANAKIFSILFRACNTLPPTETAIL
jgi:hypothetical protein